MNTDPDTIAILNVKKAPNKLYVGNDSDGDNSVIRLHPNKMEELDLIVGDTVLVHGKKRHSTIAIVQRTIENDDNDDEEIKTSHILMNRVMRDNLRVRHQDLVRIKSVQDVPNLSSVTISPVEQTIQGIAGDWQAAFVKPYVQGNRPLHDGDIFVVDGAFKKFGFKVTELKKSENEEVTYGLVTENTIIVKGAPYNYDDENMIGGVGYDDIGGINQQLAMIREMVELPIRHPALFKTCGVRPPKGVLMFGPPGCGKTLIAKAVANETGGAFFYINGPEIMSGMAGEAEENLRKAFEAAEQSAPSIIFIDEIDSIATNRDKAKGEIERRVVSQMLTLMDGMKSRGGVIIIAATNRPNVLDPALRRYGRFDREIDIGVPNETGRMEIQMIHTKNVPMDEDVDLKYLAKNTHGFVGADLAQLCKEAGIICVRSKQDKIDINDDEVNVEVQESLRVNARHFEEALKISHPSSLRDTLVEVANTPMSTVGGLDEVKQMLIEMVSYPMDHEEKYAHFGTEPSKGVLFYGPPGTGKTLLAKAIATECSANFISIKGPEMITKWVGESESNIRELFDKARTASPCILFFDELDSIAKSRGNSHDSGVGDRVVNQILTEMDGVGRKKNVFFIGATNAPGIIDTALLRPGRLDQLIYIPLPDLYSRESILKAMLKSTPLSDEVNLQFLAQQTEGFSGADLAQLTQEAANSAIKEMVNFEVRMQQMADMSGEEAQGIKKTLEDMLLTRKHFNDAVQVARKSTKMETMQLYEDFRRKYDPQYSKQQKNNNGQTTFDWGSVGTLMDEELNDDGLY